MVDEIEDDDKADLVELLAVLVVISAAFREMCRSSNLANQIFANWAKKITLESIRKQLHNFIQGVQVVSISVECHMILFIIARSETCK